MTAPGIDRFAPDTGVQEYLRGLSDSARERLAQTVPALGWCDFVDSFPGCLRSRRPVDAHVDPAEGADFAFVCWQCRRVWHSSLPAEALW